MTPYKPKPPRRLIATQIDLAPGPGYRIYFGIEDKELIVLLAGGDKQSQQRDIDKANWNEYQRKTHGTS